MELTLYSHAPASKSVNMDSSCIPTPVFNGKTGHLDEPRTSHKQEERKSKGGVSDEDDDDGVAPGDGAAAGENTPSNKALTRVTASPPSGRFARAFAILRKQKIEQGGVVGLRTQRFDLENFDFENFELDISCFPIENTVLHPPYKAKRLFREITKKSQS
jgi:hypothetical protein